MSSQTLPPSELPRLASVDNFRDVAGTGDGYAVQGGRMRRGVFFRSNRIEATDEDVAVLEALGVTAVHDLREDHEVERHPDRELSGAVWLQHVVPGIPMNEVESLSSAKQTLDTMIMNYRTFVTNPLCRAGVASALTAMDARPGPQLFHCAAGKDRTGWVTIILHHIAGLDRDTMVADYLLTDQYAVNSRKATLDSILENLGPARAPAYEPAFRCDTAYLDAAFEDIDAVYGDMDGYIAGGLGLTGTTIDGLRTRLVAPC